MRKVLLCLLIPSALLAACGDNTRPGDDDDTPIDSATPDAEVPDGIPPDAYFCAPFDVGRPGGTCTNHADCDSAPGAGDGYCYAGAEGSLIYPAEGYCLFDDFSGGDCTTDADCGDRAQCVNSGTPETPYFSCFPTCCEGLYCPAGQACFDTFIAFPLDKPSCVPGDAASVDGDACAGFYECNETSLCRVGIDFPGGMCSTFLCTLGDDTTCHGDATCVQVDDYPTLGAHCFATCTTNADCRETEGYVCFDPDGAGTAANYCRHPQAGDACATADDCGGGSWACLGAGDGYPSGYCTQTTCPTLNSLEGCGTGAVCVDGVGAVGNMCADRCETPGDNSDCRTGYSCVDVPGALTGGACVPTP